MVSRSGTNRPERCAHRSDIERVAQFAPLILLFHEMVQHKVVQLNDTGIAAQQLVQRRVWGAVAH